MSHAPRPVIIGHRGASGYRPEHTRSAYTLALALGAEALEPDIVATRDGVLVLRHENEISGTTDVAAHPEFAARRTTKEIDGRPQTGWFTEDFTWAELATLRAKERLGSVRESSASFDGQFPILRLAEVIEILDASAPGGDERAGASDARAFRPGLVAEIKHATYFDSIGLPLDELFTAELAEAGWAPDDERLTVESFEKTVLDRLAHRGVGARRIYLLEDEGAPYDLVAANGSAAADYAAVMTDAGLAALGSDTSTVHGISVDKSLLFEAVSPLEAAAAAADGRARASTTDLVDRAHRAGLLAYCWTLRPENRFLHPSYRNRSGSSSFGDWRGEFEAIMRTGIDGVFADHPDLALEARAAL